MAGWVVVSTEAILIVQVTPLIVALKFAPPSSVHPLGAGFNAAFSVAPVVIYVPLPNRLFAKLIAVADLAAPKTPLH